MAYAFEFDKLVQAAGVLLMTTEPRRMSRLRLLKLLYLADRESIRQTGFPITGDAAYAMENGPVLTRAYDCIKGIDYYSKDWRRFFRDSGRWDVELNEDPGVQLLSRGDIDTLRQAAAHFAERDDWELVEFTHTLPEWQAHQPAVGSSERIPEREILEAVGLAEYADEILADARAYARIDELRRAMAHE